MLLVFVALFYGLMAHADLLSTSHDWHNGPLHEHASTQAAPSGGHDHDHDDPESDGSQLGHHDAADHSHDTPNLLSGDEAIFLNAKDVWHMAAHGQGYPAPYFPFERPPREHSLS